MNIQNFILSLFPKHYELHEHAKELQALLTDSEREASRLRIECQQLAKNLNSSRCEVFELRREFQAEKLRNELPKVVLTRSQILRLLACTDAYPEIQKELEHAYEKYVQLDARKERQSDSL